MWFCFYFYFYYLVFIWNRLNVFTFFKVTSKTNLYFFGFLCFYWGRVTFWNLILKMFGIAFICFVTSSPFLSCDLEKEKKEDETKFSVFDLVLVNQNEKKLKYFFLVFVAINHTKLILYTCNYDLKLFIFPFNMFLFSIFHLLSIKRKNSRHVSWTERRVKSLTSSRINLSF